jgi:quinol monooxygenase YgiN
MAIASAGAQTENPAPADARFFAVSYVDVVPSARTMAVAAFKEYGETNRKQDGRVAFELFEQVGRPAHFAVVETWRDQKAFDARQSSTEQRLLDGLAPIRVSGVDQRPYKALAVESLPRALKSGAVSVVAHVDVAPDPRVAPMLKRLAEVSRRDAGNLRFDVLQHTMRANHFTVIETWSDQKALDEHAAAAHTKQYRDELQPFTGSPLDERVYKRLD